MYIAPNSTVKLLLGVPLLNTYEDSLYFPTVGDQTAYFNSKASITLTDQMYQRHSKNTLRVRVRMSQLHTISYMMFQNTGFDSKWFYAFVTKCEYINNEVSEITYEIDVIQTYLFNWQFGQCFIERQHTVSDNLFEHTIEENLPIGDGYVALGGFGATSEYNMNDMDVIMYCTEYPDGTRPTISMKNHVCMPLIDWCYHVIVGGQSNQTAIDALQAKILEYVNAGKEDAIVQIFQCPAVANDTTNYRPNIHDKTVDYYVTQFNYGLNAYNPKNKKCFNYPYHFMRVSNNSGTMADYHFEDFDIEAGVTDDFKRLTFQIAGTPYTQPNIICTPKNHRKVPIDYDYSVTYNNFPEIPFIGDAFQAWWAQKKYAYQAGAMNLAGDTLLSMLGQGQSNQMALVNSPGRAVQGMDVAGFGTMAKGALDLETDMFANIKSHDVQPPDLHGNALIDGLNLGLERCKFSFYEMGVKPDIIERIDNFFTKFGYAVMNLGVPLLKARPHWTYIKTAGCVFNQIFAPVEDMQIVTAIFDKGITFWVNASEMGDYSLDNSPIYVPPTT